MLNDKSNLCTKLENIDFLTIDEEYELIDSVHKDMNKNSIKKLVKSYSYLVFKIARYFKEYKIPLNDLIQEGYVGVMKAISRFDKSLGYRFSTYAKWWIRSEINNYIKKNKSIVLSPSKINHQEYENNFFTFNYNDLSLNNNVNEQSELTFQDYLIDETVDMELSLIKDQEQKILKKTLEQILSKIDKVEADVIKKLFLSEFPNNYEQLQNEMHLNKQKIKKIEYSALRKIRHIFLKNLLDPKKKFSIMEFIK